MADEVPKYDASILAKDVAADAPLQALLAPHATMFAACAAIEKSTGDLNGPLWHEKFALKEPLLELLKAHPLFSQGKELGVGNSGFHTSPNSIVDSMLDAACEWGPVGAIGWLRKIHACTHTEMAAVSAVSGLNITDPIGFSNGQTICRAKHIPWCARAKGMEFDIMTVPFGQLMHPAAKAHCFVWGDVEAKITAAGEKRLYETQGPREKQRDLIVALALDPSAAPTTTTWWTEFLDPVFQIFSKRGWGQFGQKDDGPEQNASVSLAADTKALVEAYLALTGDWRNACAIALNTIHLSRRFLRPAGKALQLCIGLEALLGPDGGTGEIIHKVATRAAVILADSYADRVEKQKAFRKLYDVRSKLVHGKVAKDEKIWQALKPTVSDIARLSRLAVQRPDGFPVQHIDLMGSLPTAAAT
ncbi:HEPN domain-containing protein [Rhizorhabdus dicambivorans]|nr:HEPN domain-containing protein [Rhizorhabdus dicambivorans]ATE64439.1 hypothetical protein CMV14_08545 [Rhizorhabdus dicambivorans]